jgi:DNA-binding NarL/FixJ family response regulator
MQPIVEGETTKVIAHRLWISTKTVVSHRMQVLDRLQIFEGAGLVRYAIRTGPVSSDL